MSPDVLLEVGAVVVVLFIAQPERGQSLDSLTHTVVRPNGIPLLSRLQLLLAAPASAWAGCRNGGQVVDMAVE